MPVMMREFKIYDAGEYEGYIESIADENGNFGPQFHFAIKFVNCPKYASDTLHVWASKVLTPKSKLFRWATVMGNTIQKGVMFDEKVMVGKPIRISIGVTQKVDQKTGQVGPKNQIEIVGLSQGQVAPAQPQYTVQPPTQQQFAQNAPVTQPQQPPVQQFPPQNGQPAPVAPFPNQVPPPARTGKVGF